MAESLEFRHGPSCDSRCGLFVHGMDDDVCIVEGENTVRLIAMGKEAAREGVPRNQADYRMTCHPRGGIRICRGRGCQEDTCRLFAATVGLAFNVDYRNDRTLF